jgi:uncharacterized protein YjbJ (UPF0337 family)
MASHEMEGKRKKVEGTIRREIGKATGDKSEEARGEGERIEGAIEEGAVRAKRKVAQEGKHKRCSPESSQSFRSIYR